MIAIDLPPLRRAHLKLDLVQQGAIPVSESVATDWHVPESTIIYVPILNSEGWFVVYDSEHASVDEIRRELRDAGLVSTIHLER